MVAATIIGSGWTDQTACGLEFLQLVELVTEIISLLDDGVPLLQGVVEPVPHIIQLERNETRHFESCRDYIATTEVSESPTYPGVY